MAYRRLPGDTRHKITEYFEHRYQGKFFDERKILGELSDRLRENVVSYNCRALIASVPFFINADSSFVSEVVTKLDYEVFQPGGAQILRSSLCLSLSLVLSLSHNLSLVLSLVLSLCLSLSICLSLSLVLSLVLSLCQASASV